MAGTEQELAAFVREALQRGASREEIERALTSAGWPAKDVAEALAHYAEVDFPLPVPRPPTRSYLSARDAFLYLVLFTALGLSAFYLGNLIFQLINMAFPDAASPAASGRWSDARIRWAVAMLIVSFPLYLFLAYKTEREIAADPQKLRSGVRKWLTYITLFVASMIILGDLVVLVDRFLAGELTIRIGLKILTVAVISGAIFLYYLRSASRGEVET